MTKLFFHYLDLPRWLKLLLLPVVFPIIKFFEYISSRMYFGLCCEITLALLVAFIYDYIVTHMFSIYWPHHHIPCFGVAKLWVPIGVSFIVMWVLAFIGVWRRCTLPVMMIMDGEQKEKAEKN